MVSDPLAYVLIFIVFAAVITLLVLRFASLTMQSRQSDATERAKLFAALDESHAAAFSNAIAALGSIQERIYRGQVEMFDRTTDMVHGPVRPEPQNTPFATDDPRLDSRPPWYPDDDADRAYLFADPTDDIEPEPMVVEDRTNGFAVSVRPGEGLIPQ